MLDHKSRNRPDIRTIYDGLGLTPKFGRSIFMRITLISKVCLIIIAIIAIGDEVNINKASLMKDKRKRHFMIYEVFGCVNLYNVYPAILIVEFKDTICRRTSKISLYFKKIIQGWCLLCDKPIVWPVTHLVLKMNQMLTGPGKK